MSILDCNIDASQSFILFDLLQCIFCYKAYSYYALARTSSELNLQLTARPRPSSYLLLKKVLLLQSLHNVGAAQLQGLCRSSFCSLRHSVFHSFSTTSKSCLITHQLLLGFIFHCLASCTQHFACCLPACRPGLPASITRLHLQRKFLQIKFKTKNPKQKKLKRDTKNLSYFLLYFFFVSFFGFNFCSCAAFASLRRIVFATFDVYKCWLRLV